MPHNVKQMAATRSPNFTSPYKISTEEKWHSQKLTTAATGLLARGLEHNRPDTLDGDGKKTDETYYIVVI